MELLKVIPIVLKAIASVAQKPLQRNALFIKALKDSGFDPEHPPAEFGGVYAYALVEYGLSDEGGKSEALLRLFAEPEMKAAFKDAFDQWNPALLNAEIDRRLDWKDFGNEWNFVGNAIREQSIDVQQEVKVFFAAFLEVVKRSQTPKEQLQTILLSDIQQEIKQIRLQLAPVTDRADSLVQQLDAWFDVLGYGREGDRVIKEKYFELTITIPVRRKRYDRVVVRGVEGEAGMADVIALQASVEEHKADEGWLVSKMRVSSAARKAAKEDEAYEAISCYTLDELLDEDADFSQYLEWLEEEIKSRRIDQDYIALGCFKEEIDPKTKIKLGTSHYGEDEGWIEGYVDQWLADSSKGHLSVLGEFGTGKTWFVMHYAWLALQAYKAAKEKKVARPRLPLVIPLRDYAKAVSMESLFSEFFFRKHEIPLPGYSAFEQLNRMGKLLLIFDGFDEMAARTDLQAMIDNFWEMARVVVPGAKAILTCRTEHFPDAIAGRETLGAQRKASTANLTGEPPQFEVLELAKFEDDQIAQLLGNRANETAVQAVMGNSQLLDLARRPVMVDLILAALPEIEAGKQVDMARVYLYAVTRKMAQDIKSERTFTSLADKLYFLCELSWEMLSTNQMSLNYRAFPERLRLLFADRVKEEKELDHWRYDMMGQTMLIRNAEGDYSPAHRSLLEFFVAYKIVASLGAMADDFTDIAREQSHVNQALPGQGYTWESYFRGACNSDGKPEVIAPLRKFDSKAIEELVPLLGQAKLAKAVLDLAHPMLDKVTMREQLLPLLQATANKTLKEVGYLGGNTAQLMLAQTPHALIDADLSRVKLQGVDFTKTFLRRVTLQGAQLAEAPFSKVLGSVYAVAYSPEGNHLAIGDAKGILQVWDLMTGQAVLFCSGHSAAINSVAYSPDGQQLATGSDDKTVKLWDAQRGECIRTLAGHEDGVRSVAYSPDGQQLASGSDDKTVKLWACERGECICTLAGHENLVLSVAYSPDGQQLATGSDDSTVKLWDAQRGEYIRTLAGHEDGVLSVAYSSDGQQLATGSDDNTVKLWDAQRGECIRTLAGHEDGVGSVAYSPDGQQLATGSDDNTVKLWDAQRGECIRTLAGHERVVLSVAYSPDGQQLATGSDDKTVKLWDAQRGECIRTLAGHEDGVLSVAYSPDGQQLATGSDDNTVRLWDAQRGECIRTLAGHERVVLSVAYSPDGQQLATGSDDNTVRLWDAQRGECIRTLAGHENRVLSVAYSPDGQQLATGSDDNTVKLWDAQRGECIRTLAGHEDGVLSVAYSPDGQQLATGSDDNTVKLWDAQRGECIRTLEGHESVVWSVAYSPDGQQLATGSADKTVKLWDAQRGECIRTLAGHENRVLSVAYSPDGQQLATGSYDNTVKLWDAQRGECTRTLAGHENWVGSVAYSPDGQQLASGSDDSTMRVWDVETGSCISVIDDRVCAGLNITGAIGLTAGQRTALKLMGAVEDSPS